MTPEQEEQVRRALGAVARAEDGPGEPGHAPATSRTGSTTCCHELVADRAGRAGSATAAGLAADAAAEQDELAARRHRRWPNVLVAAAAVAVIAAAGGAVATRGFGGGGAESGSARLLGRPGRLRECRDRGATDALGLASGDLAARQRQDRRRPAADALVADARRATSAGVVAAGPEAYLAPQRTRPRPPGPARVPDRARCGRPDVPRGADVVAVHLDGEPATLVIGPVKDGARVARVYSCDDAARARSTRPGSAPPADRRDTPPFP